MRIHMGDATGALRRALIKLAEPTPAVYKPKGLGFLGEMAADWIEENYFDGPSCWHLGLIAPP